MVSGGVEAEPPDTFAAVQDRVRPDHDEVAVRLDGDGGVVLIVDRRAIDLELDALPEVLAEQGTTAEQTPHHSEAELRSPTTRHDASSPPGG